LGCRMVADGVPASCCRGCRRKPPRRSTRD